MFPYPDLPRLPVTSTANGQLLSGHSIPLHSIKFQTAPLISRKFHDILLKCTRKSASRSAFGQLPLERRMRIQRGKGKKNNFAWISNRLVTCADIRQNPPDGTFFLPHCLTGMLQSLQNAAHTCRSVRQQLWTERSGPIFFLLLLGAY